MLDKKGNLDKRVENFINENRESLERYVAVMTGKDNIAQDDILDFLQEQELDYRENWEDWGFEQKFNIEDFLYNIECDIENI